MSAAATMDIQFKYVNKLVYLFRVETIDGSATEGNDYIKVDEILTFQPNETEKEVRIFSFKIH